MPVQEGVFVTTAEEAVKAFEQMGGKFAVLKAQVHAGGRGKQVALKLVNLHEEATDICETQMVGLRLVTYQTDSIRSTCKQRILVSEDVYPVERELYLGAVVDRQPLCDLYGID